MLKFLFKECISLFEYLYLIVATSLFISGEFFLGLSIIIIFLPIELYFKVKLKKNKVNCFEIIYYKNMDDGSHRGGRVKFNTDEDEICKDVVEQMIYDQDGISAPDTVTVTYWGKLHWEDFLDGKY